MRLSALCACVSRRPQERWNEGICSCMLLSFKEDVMKVFSLISTGVDMDFDLEPFENLVLIFWKSGNPLWPHS